MAKTSDRKRSPSARQVTDVDGFSDDYLSVIAHDLRGSLNSIIGWAELIKRKALPEDGHVKAGETIIRQARNPLELLNEMIDTWTPPSRHHRLKLAPVHVEHVANKG